MWKAVLLEDAYIKRRKTDLKVDSIRQVAKGLMELASAMDEFEAAVFQSPEMPETSAIIKTIPESELHPGGQYRLAGDRFVLVEYGPVELDLNLRARIHLLRNWLEESNAPGLVETNPGVRSLLIEYDQVCCAYVLCTSFCIKPQNRKGFSFTL